MAIGTVMWMTSSSPEQNAKMNRQRQGDRALEELAKQALAVRKNMAKLRALRLARETEQQGRSTVRAQHQKQP
jgi:hypothetical protein